MKVIPEITLGYDLREPIGRSFHHNPSIHRVFWPSLLRTYSDREYIGPFDYFASVEATLEAAKKLDPEVDATGVLIEVTILEYKHPAGEISRDCVAERPPNIPRKRLIGYDISDYYRISQRRGQALPLYNNQKSAQYARGYWQRFDQYELEVFGIYELQRP